MSITLPDLLLFKYLVLLIKTNQSRSQSDIKLLPLIFIYLLFFLFHHLFEKIEKIKLKVQLLLYSLSYHSNNK